MFTVIILTKNESRNIAACLKSVAWADDVVVLDSFSEDDTRAIAAEMGARVFERAFDDFASQRNYAMRELDLKHPWVFHLDADERFTPELLEECERVIALDEKAGYFVPNRMQLQGKWIRHASQYPVYQMRFMKVGEVEFEQMGHGQREKGPADRFGYFTQPYDHEICSKGMTEWFDRHNRYAEGDVEELVSLALSPLKLSDFLGRDPVRRRRAWRTISLILPFRPFFRFWYLFLIRGGILDGRPGWQYCRMMWMYEWLILLKAREIRRRQGYGGQVED